MSNTQPSPLQRHPVAAYLAITYLVTWAFLLPLGLAAIGIIALRLPPEWHALGALGPFLGALAVTHAVGGHAAVQTWLRGFTRWRVGARWWLLAAASPFIAFAVSALLVRATGGGWPDFSRLARPEYANRTWLLDVLFVGTLAYGLGEEPGWRGFLLPRLQQRYSPLLATLLLTPLWALFHWPAFLYRPTYQGGLATVIGFLFGLCAGAIVLTFLWNGTRGSLLLVALWHTLINIALQIAAIVSVPVLAVMNVFIFAGAVVIIAHWQSRRRSQSATLQQPATIAAEQRQLSRR